MSVNASTNGHQSSNNSEFEEQREYLMREISVNLEQVLQNLNKLNRSLEGVISVGNEFSSVEALWSHFENVMAKKPDDGSKEGDGQGGIAEEGDETVTAAQSAKR